jgi:CheY-like chemotaxis protein
MRHQQRSVRGSLSLVRRPAARAPAGGGSLIYHQMRHPPPDAPLAGHLALDVRPRLIGSSSLLDRSRPAVPVATGPVLVIADDEPIRCNVSRILASAGYAVLTATDGAAGLSHAEQRLPALILLDSSMPIMDGYQFVQHYRNCPPPHAPVVVFTPYGGAAAARHAAELGAAGYLSTPVDISLLLATVRRYAGLPLARPLGVPSPS